MTKRELLKRHDRVLAISNQLGLALQSLGAAASEILGEETIAEICDGEEIEFRRVGEDGVVDDTDTIRIEEILERI